MIQSTLGQTQGMKNHPEKHSILDHRLKGFTHHIENTICNLKIVDHPTEKHGKQIGKCSLPHRETRYANLESYTTTLGKQYAKLELQTTTQGK